MKPARTSKNTTKPLTLSSFLLQREAPGSSQNSVKSNKPVRRTFKNLPTKAKKTILQPAGTPVVSDNKVTRKRFFKRTKSVKPVLTASIQTKQTPLHRSFNQYRKNVHPKVLMFGWELPPFNSGGLGVASYELAKAMSNQGADITFVLPRNQDVQAPFMKLRFASNGHLKYVTVDTLLSPYITSSKYDEKRGSLLSKLYGNSLFEEVKRYAEAAREIARTEPHDIIHSHEWLSFPAGSEAKKVSMKPLVSHVHATEFDRTGSMNVNQQVYDVEREGLHFSDRVISVSDYTKQKIVNHYGIPDWKVDVVHNGINMNDYGPLPPILDDLKRQGKKIVLFVGRLTLQKGPDYFLSVAKKVSAIDPDVMFIIAGAGDMENQIIRSTASMGLTDKVMFAGFLRGHDLNRLYQSADIFVMPSVSEPFGIAALESVANRTPVIVSRQSGVAEVLTNSLKVDFWDVDEMANKILCTLHYKPLHDCLADFGAEEIVNCNWDLAATKTLEVYNRVLGN